MHTHRPVVDHALAREAQDPTTTPQRLEALARGPTMTWLVAQNPATPPIRLASLAFSAHDKIRAAVASNPNTPWEVLERLLHEFPQAVMNNPVMPLQLLAQPELVMRLQTVAPDLVLSEHAPLWLLNRFVDHPPASDTTQQMRSLYAILANDKATFFYDAARYHVNMPGDDSADAAINALHTSRIDTLPLGQYLFDRDDVLAAYAMPSWLLDALLRQQSPISQAIEMWLQRTPTPTRLDPLQPAMILTALAKDPIRFEYMWREREYVLLLADRHVRHFWAAQRRKYTGQYDERAIALDPLTPVEELVRILQRCQRRFWHTLYPVILHPNMTTAQLSQLAQPPAPITTRLKLARYAPLSEALFASFIQEHHMQHEMLRMLVMNLTTTPAMLEVIAADAPLMVAQLARERLRCRDHPEFGDYRLAWMQKLLYPQQTYAYPLERLLALAGDFVTGELLARQARSVHWIERYIIARHENTFPATLQQLTHDSNRFVRAAARARRHE